MTTPDIDQILADLEWIIHGPPLVAPQFFRAQGIESLNFDELQRIDLRERVEEELHLGQQSVFHLSSRRVGNYFERLVFFALGQLPNTCIEHRNLQIFEDSRTVGEIDCVYRRNDVQTHLEVAVKFYLLQKSTCVSKFQSPSEPASLEELHQLVGPNPADSLAAKLQHLLEKQLPMSQRLSGTRIDRHELLTRGVLHFHRSTVARTLPVQRRLDSPVLAAEYLTGTWLHRSETQNHFHEDSHDAALFYFPTKPYWLGFPQTNNQGAGQLAKSAKSAYLSGRALEYIERYFDSGRRALLAFILHRNPQAQPTQNIAWERCFIVDDSWPN